MSGIVFIEDGQGAGYKAGVNSANRVRVSASTFSDEHRNSEAGNAYFLNTASTADTLTLDDGNSYYMLYLRNDSNSQTIVIEKVLASTDTTGIVMKWLRNPTLTTAGANNVVTPVNMNFGSNRTANGTFYSWDETGSTGITGISGGSVVNTFIVGTGFNVFPIDGAILLTPNTSFAIVLTNNTGGAVEVECGVRMYYEDSDL